MHYGYDVSDILTMISDLPRLEVLEVFHFTRQALELRAFNIATLSKMPKLRRVDCRIRCCGTTPLMTMHQAISLCRVMIW